MSKRKIETISTEEKIKTAASRVFLRKGFSATRTRDIAEDAGINVALLNYYFRSKQKLFDAVMREKIQKLMGSILPILTNSATTLEDKIDLIATSYIEVLSKNPDLPIFVLNELRKKNFEVIPQSELKKAITQSSFFYQVKERRSDINPLHFFMAMLGMTVFPFVVKPMLLLSDVVNEKKFLSLMQERKKLIPLWMKVILKSK